MPAAGAPWRRISASVCGMVTQYCVASTYFAAFDHDLSPYLAMDACISTRENVNDAIYEVVKTMDIGEIESYLKDHKRID